MSMRRFENVLGPLEDEEEEEDVDDLDEEEEEDLDDSDMEQASMRLREDDIVASADDGFVVVDDHGGDEDDESQLEHFATKSMVEVSALLDDNLSDQQLSQTSALHHSMPLNTHLAPLEVLEVQVFLEETLCGSVFCSRDTKLSSVRKRIYAEQLLPQSTYVSFLTPAGAMLTARQERTHRVVMIAMPLGTGLPPAFKLRVREDVAKPRAGTRSVGTQTPSKFPRSLPQPAGSATGERRYVCDVRACFKAYLTPRSLEEHNRIHTGERPYACTTKGCSRSFRTSTELARHKRLHTGEKPYQCQTENCGKLFRRRHHMIEHGRMHLPDRPFECGECKRTFKHSDSLKRHLKTMHAGNDGAASTPVQYPPLPLSQPLPPVLVTLATPGMVHGTVLASLPPLQGLPPLDPPGMGELQAAARLNMFSTGSF